MKNRIVALTAAFVLAAASGASAQFAPSFLPPNPGDDIGVYLVDGEFSNLGIQGIWRTTGSFNLGVRAGFLDAANAVLQIGAETWGPINLEGADVPVDLAWTAGAGASLADGANSLGIPVGVTIGHTFDVGDIAVQAYGHPQLALSVFSNPVTDDLETDLGVNLALGTDVYLTEKLTGRVALSLGDAEVLGIGVAWRQ